MRLKPGFLSNTFSDEFYLVPTSGEAFNGVIKGNKTLEAVAELLKEETTEEEIIRSMKARFDAPEGVIERDVRRVVEELTKIDALE